MSIVSGVVSCLRIGYFVEIGYNLMMKNLLSIFFALYHTLASAQKIGFVLSTEQEERYEKDKKFFIEKVEQLGGDVLFGSADNLHSRQVSIVKDLLDKVKVLVIQPVDSKKSAEIAKLAKAKGVKVIAYDRIIYNADIDAYITHDSLKVGVLQAMEAMKVTSRKGLYLILAGQKEHSVAKEITAGNLYVIRRVPDVKIVRIAYHEKWSPEEAYETTKEILKNYSISAILANNSGLARGAIRALREVGLEGKVFVAGADADLENCRYIVKGIQNVEVLKAIKPLAYLAAEIAVKMSRGIKPKHHKTISNYFKEVPTFLASVQLVTRENIDDVIIKSGFHSVDEVYPRH